MELFWRDTLTCPTEKEFLDMVNDSKYQEKTRKKKIVTLPFSETGGLLRLAVKLMQEASQSTV